MQDPGEPPRPEELPGNTPDELPLRGPEGPRTASAATDAGIADLPGSVQDLELATGDNVKVRFEMNA
jgi:hypothetical protein